MPFVPDRLRMERAALIIPLLEPPRERRRSTALRAPAHTREPRQDPEGSEPAGAPRSHRVCAAQHGTIAADCCGSARYYCSAVCVCFLCASACASGVSTRPVRPPYSLGICFCGDCAAPLTPPAALHREAAVRAVRQWRPVVPRPHLSFAGVGSPALPAYPTGAAFVY